MREQFVSSLITEALGPRNGIREVLDESPLGEYITGVLAPDPGGGAPARNIDDEALLPVEGLGGGEEDGDTDADLDLTGFAPVLDPKSKPHSLGITFVVESEAEVPRIDVCVTWAIYEEREARRNKRQWVRSPRARVLVGLPIITFDSTLSSSDNQAPEVSIHIRGKQNPERPRQWTASVYLVNRLTVSGGDFATSEHHVFQPQIRVRFREGVQIVGGLEGTTGDADGRVLRFLYRDRPVQARGHLCSAVWRAVDPESEVATPGYPEGPVAPPFSWVDGDLLSGSDRDSFFAPDLRTEYVPVFPVVAPELELDPEWGTVPELSAARLAEAWDPTLLRSELTPLFSGYRLWIEAQRVAASSTPDVPIAEALIADCDTALERLRIGIELLATDPQARLAFCFAMRALHVQSAWSGSSRPLAWRPFQLAFVIMTLESIVNPASQDRDICDLLWVPTGAGKTEAYLALAAFTMAHRRLRSRGDAEPATRSGSGVAVLSRYTLRLLTIQQFRRALRMVSACEKLRVDGVGTGRPVGWRPVGCPDQSDVLWGSTRFSVGLWVGGGVTPNRLDDTWGGRTIAGALSILSGATGEGEPAQVMRCPACDALLSVPHREEGGLPAGRYVLHLIIRGALTSVSSAVGVHGAVSITAAAATVLGNGFHRLSLEVDSGTVRLGAEDVDGLWAVLRPILGTPILAAMRAARPGYFPRTYTGNGGVARTYDFEVCCPGPDCPLEQPWFEGAPAGSVNGSVPAATAPTGAHAGISALSDGNRFAAALEPFRSGSPYVASRIPVPACTVDSQVYARCPSMIIATVDKFARPAFEPRAGALFGHVDHHHCLHGYYRLSGGQHPTPVGRQSARTYTAVPALAPPDLILQDELHLIEGPLGSMVGLYEAGIDLLTRDHDGNGVKYIASTATVRQAGDQVRSVFDRRLAQFPPPGLTVDDSYFVRFRPGRVLDEITRGRLYVGICAPGKGPLTPVLRIWARLLQTAYDNRGNPHVDGFWTLAGYFNAVRELAGARALYRQDIPERLRRIAPLGARPIPEDRSQELSGRTDSTQLPGVLDALNEPLGQDAVFATSMFGTGVDVSRLGLMVVHGQPKSTSAYIQATGRVGRERGGLVVTFLRSTRPRDLAHYEFFMGYHLQLHRFVEPITVMPFAPGALDRASGPVGVLILRNQKGTTVPWHDAVSAVMMRNYNTAQEVREVAASLERRAQSQPSNRRPPTGTVQSRLAHDFARWALVAQQHPTRLCYVEYGDPSEPVVLGDAQHEHASYPVVFRNAPTSLRDIEETCGFQTR